MKRSRVRRTGESAFGLLLLGQRLLMLLIAALLVVAGVWSSWGSAQYVLLDKGRERGTMRVERCGDERCTGAFTPSSAGGQRREVSAESSVVVRAGESVPVVLKPDGKRAVRAGAAGLLYAWLPLGGALVLAATVVAGGLRWTRTAWTLGVAGLALVTAAFVSM
ncbi:hypothetical protein [Streptomyces sp. NA04227]|uniref:hypothetical protein n=1 Tax=Streptomyces sp. NA04227 TaxID=2742136 RepID=UPI0020CA951C|nr:hypothetical protein [Streptomyces sp. NA04227]